ncbi:MAG: hypothetical protein NTX77_09165, partial [Actinobacteria bacterium]|nr:hypothetical protein [Actinomycetota bacterium]
SQGQLQRTKSKRQRQQRLLASQFSFAPMSLRDALLTGLAKRSPQGRFGGEAYAHNHTVCGGTNFTLLRQRTI